MSTAAKTSKTKKKSIKRRKPTAAQIEARKERAAALHEGMLTQVSALTSSEEWMRYLDAAKKFHKYSFGNIMLIMRQCPNASAVAGFRSWQDKGRQVRKGERAIGINGFSLKKVTETDEKTGEDKEKVINIFPTMNVFDVSQTDPIEGKEHLDPTTVTVAHRLTGADDAAIFRRVSEFLTSQGWTVTREEIAGETNGYTTTDGTRRVVVDANLSDAMAAKTALHEAAHVLLHTEDSIDGEGLRHRGIGEIEAESVAYVAAGLLGLDTSDYSVGYIAGWSNGDNDIIKAVASRVLDAANVLFEGIEDDVLEQEDGQGTESTEGAESAEKADSIGSGDAIQDFVTIAA